ncbi:MAG: hypothetical protein IKM11_01060 [Oscillospiraceae bacterium]|nr:hypothetical protein [Oscillospiraceae bacterium]
MKRKKLRTLACVLLVGFVLTAFVAIANEVGSQGDPLVTLSYLNETFLEQILGSVDEKLAQRSDVLMEQIREQISSTKRDILIELGSSYGDETGGVAVSFASVTLSAGQTLYGGTGCEVLLRSGSAVCISEGKSVPGLVDTTDGTTINHGSQLVTNHLYMMTDERGVQAQEDIVLLVRGEYTIG